MIFLARTLVRWSTNKPYFKCAGYSALVPNLHTKLHSKSSRLTDQKIATLLCTVESIMAEAELERVRDKIPLQSPEGQQMLAESPSHQPLLIRLFKEQENNTFCGIHSSALIMSARHLGKNFPSPSQHSNCNIDDIPYRESNMFSFDETNWVLDFKTCDAIGSTMPLICELLRSHGFNVKTFHAHESTKDEFCTLASEALSLVDSQKGVIVNYDEYYLGQDDFVHGHFSVLAAFHVASDRFLLLDTYFNTVDCWVKTRDLFNCMKTFDKDAGTYRGFLIVG